MEHLKPSPLAFALAEKTFVQAQIMAGIALISMLASVDIENKFVFKRTLRKAYSWLNLHGYTQNDIAKSLSTEKTNVSRWLSPIQKTAPPCSYRNYILDTFKSLVQREISNLQKRT